MSNRRYTGKLKIKIGIYSGDGEATQAITGVGFTPMYVEVFPEPVDGGAGYVFCKLSHTDWLTWCVMHNANSHIATKNRINSIDADGFTVASFGADTIPNTKDSTYSYIALGNR